MAQQKTRDTHNKDDMLLAKGSAIGEQRLPWWMWVLGAFAMAVIVFVTFSPSLTHEFVNFDDGVYVYENRLIQIFTPQSIGQLFVSFYGSNYHPLTALSNAIEFRISGLDPFLYHLDNILLHCIVSVLAYGFLSLFIKNRFAVLIGTLFFALNPLRVESVVWVSERKDLLFVLFYLAGIIWYVKKCTGSWQWGSYIILLVFYLFSLLSKSAAVVFPLSLVALDFLLKRPLFTWASVLEKLPLFLLSVLFGIIAIISQRTSGAIADLTHVWTFVERVLLSLHALGFYAWKSIFPLHLSALYFYPEKIAGSLPVAYVVSAVMVFFVLAGLLCVSRKRAWVAFVTLFYCANLILVIQIISVGQAIVSDRYAFMPSLAIAFSMSLGLQKILNMQTTAWVSRGVVAASCLMVIVLGWLSYQRCAIWKDSVSLASSIIAASPSNSYGYHLRGDAYLQKNDLVRAYADFTQSVSLMPPCPNAYISRAVVRDMQGDYHGAVADCHAALKIKPHSAEAYNNLGLALENLGDLMGADTAYSRALTIAPDQVQTYLSRGILRASRGNAAQAMADLDAYVKERPEELAGYLNRANARGMLGDLQGSIEDCNRAIALDVRCSEAYFNRGLSRIKIGDTAAGVQDWVVAKQLGNVVASQSLAAGLGVTAHHP